MTSMVEKLVRVAVRRLVSILQDVHLHYLDTWIKASGGGCHLGPNVVVSLTLD